MYETILGSKIDHISVGQPTSDINKTQNLIEVEYEYIEYDENVQA